MKNDSLTIWTNVAFPESAMQLLREGIAPHQLVEAHAVSLAESLATKRAMSTEESLATLREADIAFGQPDAETIMNAPRFRWAHITTAGYTPYDRDDLKAAFKERGAILSNSSHVYDEPCAQHALAMMLADARQLLPSYAAQRADRDWNATRLRADSYLLNGQTVLMLGYGAIAQRLAQLLKPFDVNIIAMRRQPRGDEDVEIIGEDKVESALSQADHVVNILPASDATNGFMNETRFAQMKPDARFYNIGRGTTVDQDALLAVLNNGGLALAYLDVTDPEPLPPEHSLWTAPNCSITPHTAGGHRGEFERIVRHFLHNLRAFENGEALRDRVF